MATSSSDSRCFAGTEMNVNLGCASVQNPLSSLASLALLRFNGVVDEIIGTELGESSRAPFQSPALHLHSPCSREGSRTSGPHLTRLGFPLPPHIILPTMLFLDPADLLQFRSVCRLFNEVFLSRSVQCSFVASLPRSALETTTGVNTLTEVMHHREAIVRCREYGWRQWLMKYMAATLGGVKNESIIRKMKLKGKPLRVQLQLARKSYRCATEEWLGYWADCRHAQFNIRRNWFNYSSMSCKASCGVYPVVLPDGTLCVNDPVDAVVFYAKRDRKMSTCMDLLNRVPHASSRTSEMLREMWFPIHELGFDSYVTHMSYDPYMNVLHVSVGKGITTMWRVKSGVVENLAKRLGMEDEDEESPPLGSLWMHETPTDSTPTGVRRMGSYTIAKGELDTFPTFNRDMVGLPDYEWSEAEILTKSRAQPSFASDEEDDDDDDDDHNKSRIFVLKHDRDVSTAYSHTCVSSGAPLTEKDIARIRSMLHELADVCQSPCTSVGNSVVEPASHPVSGDQSGTNLRQRRTEPDGATSEDLELSSKLSYSAENGTVDVPFFFHGETRRGKDEEESTTPRDFAVSISNSVETVTARYVFVVFNEQAVLTCVSSTTREVALFVLSAHTCVTLAVKSAENAKSVHILQAPLFSPSESASGDSIDEGEVLFACISHYSIIIYQNIILRQIEEIEKFVLDKESNAHGRSQQCGTWYFLKGYSYSSSPTQPKMLVEISTPSLLAFASPRPWITRHMQTLACWNSTNVETGCGSQEELLPHISSSWYPLRDGHPYFRDPFMLYVSRYVPYIAFRREYTKEEQNEISLEWRPVFYHVSIFDGVKLTESHVLTVALSPSHAFFVLGFLNGTILLVSPLCEEIACTDSCEVLSPGPQPESVQLGHNSTYSCSGDSPYEAENVTFQDGCTSAFVQQEVYDMEEEEHNGLSSAVVANRVPHRQTHVSRLYRTTTLRDGEQERTKWRLPLRAFSAVKLFGKGFLEDEYIMALQCGVPSVFNSMEMKGEKFSMPLHGIWIVAPDKHRKHHPSSGIWTMHLDDWKLTTLSVHYEVIMYDLSLKSVMRDKNEVVFAPLLAFSPYLRHPMAKAPTNGLESFVCAQIRKRLHSELKGRATGKEINWQGGLLVVNSFFGVVRSSIFDFSPLFRDAGAADTKNGAIVPYSVKRKEYHLVTPADGSAGLPRHFPLLLRKDFILLLNILMLPFTYFCATLTCIMMMLRIDGYVNMPLWASLLIYTPFELRILFKDILLYDPYYVHGCGVLFFARLLSNFLMAAVFPVLFTLKHEAYDQFHPPWLLISITLDVSIALFSLSSTYIAISRSKGFCSWMSSARWHDYIMQSLCIAFIVLLSLYFDGPSADDPRKPKFHIIFAFLPIFLLFAIILINNVLGPCCLYNRSYSTVLLCILFLLMIPSLLFIFQFGMYYSSVAANGNGARPSLTQTIFALPLILLALSLYFTFSAVVLLRS